MSKITKEDYLTVRITPTEKAEIAADAKKNGFDSTSAFILFLYRKFGKK